MIDKPIRYSAHLLWRLPLRGIEPALPARLIREASERYRDAATGQGIAVAVGEYRRAPHPMAVVYEETEAEIIVITIHPLSQADVESKLRSGRWR
jgi:hypothetical protein